MEIKTAVYTFLGVISAIILWGCGKSDVETPTKLFQLESIEINGVVNASSYREVNHELVIRLVFSESVNPGMIEENIILRKSTGEPVHLRFILNSQSVQIETFDKLESFSSYQLEIRRELYALSGNRILTGKVYSISTGMDTSDKFPLISDEQLLTLVQRQTFRYFWDFGHPISGMARERSTSGNTVTTGGTGFGVMAIIVAAEREFVTRDEALLRVQKIVTFLKDKAIRYHGAFAHWINGETGATLPFSTYDNGADLVETSLLFQGLLTARQYFSQSTPAEIKLREEITLLWEEIDWKWFQKENENTLYWHWSSQYGWQMNMKITGWNECLITYILAASSPTHSITKEVYDQGWARNGNMINNATYYGHRLPLGPEMGGPLFFAHYSFLGINPKGLKDRYADYWEQNSNHSFINHLYCVDNPRKYAGYSEHCWGLTASDGNQGYSAHSPTNDRGVIAPTAALASMPYTPEESMKALRFFYYKLGDKIWSEYGFIDAFNLSLGWFDNQHIAIDQGPIIIMIENYRSFLLWKLLMNDMEIQKGLTKLGFQFQVNPLS